MISVILYGRNDNYGYNIHKQGSLTLNNIGEVLTHEEDEIIFVDYNTPDDLPTYPEAISDTISDKVKSKLRVLRIRPEVHNSNFHGITNLKVMEPLARNVAVRNSNSSNRWILSTNIGMILIPRKSNSLTELVKDLPKGIYIAPRFEIPETLWESFNRMDPKSTILKTRKFGEEFHLNDVETNDFGYNAPGDFQLIERQDLFDNYGFEERIINGLHVDSNIQKRLAIKYSFTGDAAPFVLGYHCNHFKVITPLQKPNLKAKEDYKIYVDDMIEISASHQKKSWGLMGTKIEEISLNSPTEILYQKTLKRILKYPQLDVTYSNFKLDNFDNISFSPSHVFPYLLDKFIYLHRDIQIMWFGKGDKLFNFFSEAIHNLGFKNKVKIYGSLLNNEQFVDMANYFIVNFSELKFDTDKEYKYYLSTIINSEGKRLKNNEKQRVIYIINSNHTKYEKITKEIFITNESTNNSRIQRGFINSNFISNFYDWTSEMILGDNAIRKKNLIYSSCPSGTLAYGPYKLLSIGKYILSIEVFNQFKNNAKTEDLVNQEKTNLDSKIQSPYIRIEIIFDEDILHIHEINVGGEDFIADVPFEIIDENLFKKIQFRIMNFGFNGGLGSFKINKIEND